MTLQVKKWSWFNAQLFVMGGCASRYLFLERCRAEGASEK
jgi:hypothetical protein